jgi:Ca2+-binding RTX toxin-like protein
MRQIALLLLCTASLLAPAVPAQAAMAGDLDASFSGDGRQTTGFGGDFDGAEALALQPDGKVVAAGHRFDSTNPDFALARYLGASDSQPGPRSKCTVTGSSRGDVLFGTPGDDVICAGDGNDVVRAGGGNDTVYGGRGNDVVRAGGGNDTVYGGPGNDALRADGGSDRLYGQGGNDALNTSDGRRGNDSADGGGGDDACRVDPGDRRRSCL